MNEKLYRIPSKAVLGGVAAGLEERFGIDVSIIRVIFVLGTILTHGPFFLIYIILWIALPAKTMMDMASDYTENSNFNMTKMKNNSNSIAGIILIALGSLFLMDEFFDIDFGKLWPLVLIAVGVYIIFKDKIKGNNTNNFGNNEPGNSGF